jgi:hypothetical protein
MIDSYARALRHSIALDKPAVNFFEGALLGNGGLGVVVCTRPDGVVLHFGHNAVWDVRVDESHAAHIGTFREVFERVRAVPRDAASLEDDAWCREYFARMRAPYAKPYPRPFPCGSLLLAFDRRRVELLGHELCIADGVCTVRLLQDGQARRVEIFVEREVDRVHLRVVDAYGDPAPSPFDRIKLMPDPDTPPDFPDAAAEPDDAASLLSFRQRMPAREPHEYDRARGHVDDRGFRLAVRVSGNLVCATRENWHGDAEPMSSYERAIVGDAPFVACVQLDHGRADALHAPALPDATADVHRAAAATAQAQWRAFWARSGVALDDALLEATWHRNVYFMNCAARAGVTCPGLFANWSYRSIGTAWHGDYHMNYNTQQPFWMTFSTNHLELHLPYVELVEFLLPLSRSWAQNYYELPGAYFPHSAYPTNMSVMPYPVPDWGWEICETPWTVQSLWWHFTYSRDVEFLRTRAFTPIKAAVEFLVAYVQRPEAHGPQWGDDRLHIFPTVPPELYGLRPGFDRGYDCLVDLTLTRFVLRAFLEACGVLSVEEREAPLLATVREVLARLPGNPMAETPAGRVFVSVPGERPGVVYNLPNSTMTVFPGEEHGLGSPHDEYEVCLNSLRTQRNEGGNELVMLNLQAARLGVLDIEKFKRQVRYCLLPNGTCADMVLQTLGRYDDARTPFDFMATNGIWFENFALPAVIDECLLQSWDGVLRLFPNWPARGRAEFSTLRARGALLVSAAMQDGVVEFIEIVAEADGDVALQMPAGWRAAGVRRGDGRAETLAGERVRWGMARGERVVVEGCN